MMVWLAGNEAVAGPQSRLIQLCKNGWITLGNQIIQVHLEHLPHDHVLLPGKFGPPVRVGWEAFVLELLLPLLLVADRRRHLLDNVRPQPALGSGDHPGQLVQADKTMIRVDVRPVARMACAISE